MRRAYFDTRHWQKMVRPRSPRVVAQRTRPGLLVSMMVSAGIHRQEQPVHSSWRPFADVDAVGHTWTQRVQFTQSPAPVPARRPREARLVSCHSR